MYTIVIRTLKHFNKYKLPITKDELFDLAIFSEEEIPKNKEKFEETLKQLFDRKILHKQDNFLSLDNRYLPINIKYRSIAERRYDQMVVRCTKHAHQLRQKHIKSLLLIKNQFLYGNPSNPQESTDILLIAEKGKEHLARLKLKRFLKSKKIRYRYLHMLTDSNLSIPKDIEWAHALSTAQIIKNDGCFNKLIDKNSWLFEMLKNYPLSKLTINGKYKIENTIDKEKRYSRLTKTTNTLAKFICDKLYS